VRRACETLRGYLRLGAEVIDGPGATFVRNRECPRRHDANHADSVLCETPAAMDALFAAAEHVYAEYAHRRYDVDLQTPPQFEARLVLEGYTRRPALQSILEGPLVATPRDIEIREVADDAGWAAYARLLELDIIGGELKEGKTREEIDLSHVPQWLRYQQMKRPDVRFWLAYDNGAARGYFASWPGENGAGMVEDLFTEEPYRHRGIATALIAHCVADARARGAREVIIGADPNDTPRHMYAAMGFRPLMVTANYVRVGVDRK
jgi:GNAT superfamily N-acetyltransferase